MKDVLYLKESSARIHNLAEELNGQNPHSAVNVFEDEEHK